MTTELKTIREGPTLYMNHPTLGPEYRMWAVRYWNERITEFAAVARLEPGLYDYGPTGWYKLPPLR